MKFNPTPTFKTKTSTKVFLTAMIVLVSGIGLLLKPELHKRTSAAPTLTYKGVDVMKYTKDVLHNQPSDAQIQGIVDAIVRDIKPTHISISVPLDPTSDYPQKPGPRTAEEFTQKWVDAIHSRGVKVIFRGTWSGIEGIYSFPKRVGSNRLPSGTAQSAPTDGTSTWLGKTYKHIIDHPSYFQPGDIWALLPERTENIFQDSTSFLSHDFPGIQTNYAKFFNDLKAVSDSAFAKIGKTGVSTGLTANNFTEINSSWMLQSVLNTAGMIVIDHYGSNHTPEEMEADIRRIHSARGLKVFLQEWGDYWNAGISESDRARYLDSMYAVWQRLINDGILIGFNYWGGWTGNMEGILTSAGSNTYGVNWRGQRLASFYAANGTVSTASSSLTTQPPILIGGTSSTSSTSTSTSSSGSSTTTLAVPVATSTASISTLTGYAPGLKGEYFDNIDLTNPKLARLDSSINFDWGSDRSPHASIGDDTFSIRWTGFIQPKFSETYTFYTQSDDGIKVWINGTLVINNWTDHGVTENSGQITLAGGQIYSIKIEYYENTGGTRAALLWSSPSQPKQYIPSVNLLAPLK